MADLEAARRAVNALLDALDVPISDHLAETPQRVAKAWADAVAGYDTDPAVHLKTRFPGPPEPGLIVVAGIDVQSTCAHHLLPITGTATVAYRPHPGDSIVGLSKLARLVDGYARRLQIQETLGYQIASTLWDELTPHGSACVITAAHGCMTLRGVRAHNARTTTYAYRGLFHDNDIARIQAEHIEGRR